MIKFGLLLCPSNFVQGSDWKADVVISPKWRYISRAFLTLDSSSDRIPVGSPQVESSHDNDMSDTYSDIFNGH